MIYVMTAVHDRKSITEKFVNSLLRQTYPEIRLVLVDDGSTDGTAKMVKQKMPDAVIIQGDGNLWWGGALHEAYKWICANGDRQAYALFSNDDVELPEDYIERGIEILKSHPKTLLTGYAISKETGERMDGAENYDFVTGVPEPSEPYGNCASTRSLFFRVEDFLTIGGFHPKALPHYGSDYEWTIRAHEKFGYSIYCDPSLRYLSSQESTGNNFYVSMTRAKVFSKRSVSNPFYKFSYIWLVTPPRLRFAAYAQQIRRYASKRKMIMDIMKK